MHARRAGKNRSMFNIKDIWGTCRCWTSTWWKLHDDPDKHDCDDDGDDDDDDDDDVQHLVGGARTLKLRQ